MLLQWYYNDTTMTLRTMILHTMILQWCYNNTVASVLVRWFSSVRLQWYHNNNTVPSVLVRWSSLVRLQRHYIITVASVLVRWSSLVRGEDESLVTTFSSCCSGRAPPCTAPFRDYGSEGCHYIRVRAHMRDHDCLHTGYPDLRAPRDKPKLALLTTHFSYL